MQPKIITLWNVSGLDTASTKLANRTSNPLERYNRWMNNDVFPCVHPPLAVFVSCLNTEAKRVVEKIDDVRKGRDEPAPHKDAYFPPIPEEYTSFRGFNHVPEKGKPATDLSTEPVPAITKKPAAKTADKRAGRAVTKKKPAKKASRVQPPRKSRNGKRAVVLCILRDVRNVVLTLKIFTKSKGNDKKLLLGIGRLGCGAFNC